MRMALLLLAFAAISGCEPPSPEVCYRRHVAQHPSRADYERCMRDYRIRVGTATFEEREAQELERRARRARIGRALAASAEANRQAEAERANRPCRQWSCYGSYGTRNCTCVRY